MDLHWESHFLHHLDLKKAPMVIYRVDNWRVQQWERLVLRYDSMGRCQVEMKMARSRIIHWKRSYLVNNVKLRYVLLLSAQIGRLVLILISVGILDVKLKGSTLGGKSLGEDGGAGIGSCNGRSHGSVHDKI